MLDAKFQSISGLSSEPLPCLIINYLASIKAENIIFASILLSSINILSQKVGD